MCGSLFFDKVAGLFPEPLCTSVSISTNFPLQTVSYATYQLVFIDANNKKFTKGAEELLSYKRSAF